MKRITIITAVLISLGLLLSGCMTAAQLASLGTPMNYARSPVLDSKPQWKTVILPPASTSTSSTIYAAGLSDYAGMALLRTGRFTVVDRSVVDQLLDEQEFSYSGAVDQATAVQLGKLLGAEAVMTTNIGSIVHDSFWDDEPAQRDASLHVKIISVETSEVLYTSTGEGSSFEGAEDALRMALEVSLIGLTQ
ncbi:MAG: CsgG/HfaB family protein [Candidatus Sabulitectum sp.]|nr:CsgG/HfaB family protein [Candidatus Sabulitectum sp.]